MMKRLLLFLMLVGLSFVLGAGLVYTPVNYEFAYFDNSTYDLDTGVPEAHPHFARTDRLLLVEKIIQVSNTNWHHVLFWDVDNVYLGYTNSSKASYQGDEYLDLIVSQHISAPTGATEFAMVVHKQGEFAPIADLDGNSLWYIFRNGLYQNYLFEGETLPTIFTSGTFLDYQFEGETLQTIFTSGTYLDYEVDGYSLAYINDFVDTFDGDTPVPLMNGLSLREVFEDGNLMPNPFVDLDSNDIADSMGGTFQTWHGVSDGVQTMTATTAGRRFNDNLSLMAGLHGNDVYYRVDVLIADGNLSFYIADTLIVNSGAPLAWTTWKGKHTVNYVSTDTMRIVTHTSTNGHMVSTRNWMLIDMDDLGIDHLTVGEMDDLYALYLDDTLDLDAINLLLDTTWDAPTYAGIQDLYDDAVLGVERWEWYEHFGVTDLNYADLVDLYDDAVLGVERWEWYEQFGVTDLNYLYLSTLYNDAVAGVERWEWYEHLGITELNYDDYRDLHAYYQTYQGISTMQFRLMNISYLVLVDDVVTGTIVLNIAMVVIALIAGLTLMVLGFFTRYKILNLLAVGPLVVAGMELREFPGFMIMMFGLVIMTLVYAFLGGKDT